MKVQVGILLLLIILFIDSNAQNRRSVWRMGYWQGGPNTFDMKFVAGSFSFDTIPSTNSMSMYINDAGICDENGNLLFYTNGIYVADASHDTMLNGGNLTPGQFADTWRDFGMPFAQSAIVLPDPALSNEYYLFHLIINSSDLSSDTLVISKIDMSLNGGLGAVTTKNQPVYIDSLISGQLTAVKHANGRDWWLIVHEFNSDAFLVFLIDPLGINGPTIQHFGQQIKYPSQGCFSPNGEWYVNYDNTYGLVLMNFDRCSGSFSNFQNFYLPDSSVSSGCCFSPNSQVLYASSRNYLYQFNLNASNIQSTMDTVAIWDGFYDPNPTQFVFQQLAPDNRIYITGWGTVKSLSVINYPDSLGVACNVMQHSVSLPGLNNGSVPNYPFYELGPVNGSICDSLNDISQRKNSNSIIIFPNPVTSQLFITSDFLTFNLIKIFDINSNLVYEFNFGNNSNQYKIDITKFTKGVYIAEIKTNNGTIHKKIVKQ